VIPHAERRGITRQPGAAALRADAAGPGGAIAADLASAGLRRFALALTQQAMHLVGAVAPVPP
jgi:hypothetical protein